MMMHSFPFRKNKRDFAVIKILTQNGSARLQEARCGQEVHCYSCLLSASSTRFKIISLTSLTVAEDVYYRQQAAVPLSSETHAGEDVPIYASGPMGHLFHATHEQHYIAHVIAYASCVGIYANEAECRDISSSAGQWIGTTLRNRVILFCVLAVWYLVHRST